MRDVKGEVKPRKARAVFSDGYLRWISRVRFEGEFGAIKTVLHFWVVSSA